MDASDDLDVAANVAALERPSGLCAVRLAGLIAAATTRPPARAALQSVLRRRVKGSTGGPGEVAHSRTGSTVLASACAADGRELNTVRLEGVNSYTFGFDVLAWAAGTVATRDLSTAGALGPVGSSD